MPNDAMTSECPIPNAQCKSPTNINPWSLELGHSLVIGHWSLVIGHWSLVIGDWSLVIGGATRPCGAGLRCGGRWGGQSVGPWGGADAASFVVGSLVYGCLPRRGLASRDERGPARRS